MEAIVKIKKLVTTPRVTTMMKTLSKLPLHLFHAHIKWGQDKCFLPPKFKGPCHLHQFQGLTREKKKWAR